MAKNETCLILGATGVGKTLLLKRLQNILYVRIYLPVQVGTNLTDLTLKKKSVTVRELGGCMGPIWPSYFNDCSSVIFIVDSANIAQVSSSCVQLLSVLSAEPLRSASVLILFNKRDMPSTMSLTEMRSLFRMDDIVASAPQSITILEGSAHTGQGLQEVLNWLEHFSDS
uniref:ADP-ribosylation factor-like 16 n=1 Tax=Cynoglossus semilaevis TaxID=244447 RepID=A0A3P8VHV6_CYNSE